MTHPTGSPTEADIISASSGESGSADEQDGVPGDRGVLLVDPTDPAATADRLRDILAKQSGLFDFGGPALLVRDQHTDELLARPLDETGVTRLAHKAAAAIVAAKVTRNGTKSLERVKLPSDVVRVYLGMQGEWHLRPLRGISAAPLLKVGGTILPAAGYDDASHMFCDAQQSPDVPHMPTRIEARQALRRLRDAFATFPFADAVRQEDPDSGLMLVDLDAPIGLDESCFIHGLLTAVCRPSLPLAPGLLIRAPLLSGAGTGKGKLVRAICAIAYGRHPMAMTAGTTRTEFDQRIASSLLEARSALFLDNINSTALRSDLLASILTEETCATRPLGRSGVRRLHSTTFVAVTGNGVQLSEDLARRFLVVMLDGGSSEPERRRFTPGFDDEILEGRAVLLADALTIWRWGQLEGAKMPPGSPIGSYEVWSRHVRDPLLALGCRDPGDAIRRTKEQDPERDRTTEVFRLWWRIHGSMPIAAKDLAPEIRRLLDPHDRGRQVIVAALVQCVGTRIGSLVMTAAKPRGRWSTTTYALRDEQPLGGAYVGSGSRRSDGGKHRGHRGHKGRDLDREGPGNSEEDPHCSDPY